MCLFPTNQLNVQSVWYADSGSIVRDATVESLRRASMAGVLGLALRVLDYQIGWPLLAQSAGIFATRLVINMTRAYHGGFSESLDNLSAQTAQILKAYPRLQVITFLCTLALSWIVPGVSVTFGVCLGAVGALTIDRGQSGGNPLVGMVSV